MKAMDVYIWGIRYGFKPHEALYPDRVHIANDESRMRQYAQVTRNFTEDKDYKFRMCERDFYFIKSDNNYRSYSLVYSGHKDIQGRQSYLVFTIVLPFHLYPKGDVIKALNNLKNLYKSKNIDYKVDRNLFTQQQIDEQVSHLSVDAGRTAIADSNAIFYYSDINQLANLFTDYTGDELYFIQEGSNSDMVAALGFPSRGQLANAQEEKQEREKSLKQFKVLFNNRKEDNAAELARLFVVCSDGLESKIKNEYLSWADKIKSSQKENEAVSNLKNLLEDAKRSNYKLDPSKAIELYSRHQKSIADALGVEYIEAFTSWKRIFVQNNLNAKNDELRQIIRKAEESNWTINPDEFLYGFDIDLQEDSDFKRLIGTWKSEYDKYRVKKIYDDVAKLYHEIKISSRSTKISKQGNWKKQIGDLNQEANSLLDSSQRQALLGQKDYKYLVSNEWVPKNLTPIVATIVLCTLILGALIFFLRSDFDNDGVLYIDDMQPNTVWPENASVKLKSVVFSIGKPDSAGMINNKEVKLRCESCDSIKDDNLWKLICSSRSKDYYRLDSVLYKRNADSTYRKVCGEPQTSPDPKVTDQLDKYFGIVRKRNQNSSTAEVAKNSSDERGQVEFDNKKYMVSIKFISDTGAVFNKRRYKYASASGWMYSENSAKSWKTAQKQDINFMLNSLCGDGRAEIVKSPTAQSNSTTITGSQTAGQTNKNQGANAAVKSQDNDDKVDCDGKVDPYLSNSGSINVAKIDSEGKDSVRKKLNCSCRDGKKEQKRVQIVKYCSK